MRETGDDELAHDILKGVLNGVEFDTDAGEDPQVLIKPLPCEVCGHPVWVGLITSSCGDTGKDVYEEDDDGFYAHKCYGEDEPEPPACIKCFPEYDEDAGEEELGLSPLLYWLDEVPVAR